MKMTLKIAISILYCLVSFAGQSMKDVFDHSDNAPFIGAIVHLSEGNLLHTKCSLLGSDLWSNDNDTFPLNKDGFLRIATIIKCTANIYNIELIKIIISSDINNNPKMLDAQKQIASYLHEAISEGSAIKQIDFQIRRDLRLDKHRNIVILNGSSQANGDQRCTQEQDSIEAYSYRDALLGKVLNKKILVASMAIAAVCGLYKWYSGKKEKSKPQNEHEA